MGQNTMQTNVSYNYYYYYGTKETLKMQGCLILNLSVKFLESDVPRCLT